jgi:four helix bundle protein
VRRERFEQGLRASGGQQRFHGSNSYPKKARASATIVTPPFSMHNLRQFQHLPRIFPYPLVGAGTSVGANYCEADDAVSGKEFKQKIGTCRKESKEGMFFLRMVAAAEEGLAAEARVLWREAKELNLIFGAIWRK